MKQMPLFAALILGTASLTVGSQELASEYQLPIKPALTPVVEPDPAATAEKVTAALKESKDVPASDITVTTHAGTIILTGEVDTEVERTATKSVAEMAAAGTRVSSSVEVRAAGERPLADQQLAKQTAQVVRDVEAALKADARTKDLGVAVTSADGHIVVLQGLVPTRASRTAVETVAAGVKGVMRVDNRLQVPGG